MLVMKFGGASLRNPEAIIQTGKILESYRKEAVLIVVSAMGKTTNALERLSNHAQKREEKQAWQVFREIESFHTEIGQTLFADSNHPVHGEIKNACEQIQRILQAIILLEDFPDRTYDRIVAYGEILSSHIVHRYLERIGFTIEWKDARKLIRTDSDYKQAEVNWTATQAQLDLEVKPVLATGSWILTQGFIGSNAQGRTTTLGREGSDFSAAIFASCLAASAQIVWKDVPGIMNADPAQFPGAVILSELSYDQIVRMSFFGASVIHPKTIRPLRNAGIPLFIRSFINPQSPGTHVSADNAPLPAPTWSIKRNQALIKIQAKDFSFLDSTLIAFLFRLFDKNGIQPNLTWISGTELQLVMEDETSNRVEALIGSGDRFTCQIIPHLTLYSSLFPKDTVIEQVAERIKGKVIANYSEETSAHWLSTE
jgi:aspartate kinase